MPSTTVAASVGKTMTLRDGRTLGYVEYGDPRGKPVMFCHGTPGYPLTDRPMGIRSGIMAHRLRTSPSTLAYMQRKLACIDAKRSRSPSAADIERLLAAMRSPDEQTRAWAVREVCPCRLPWDAFRQVRQAAKRLQHDPSPLVRANALHVEEDAREIAAMEALREWIAVHDEGAEETIHRPTKRGERWRAGRGAGRHQEEIAL